MLAAIVVLVLGLLAAGISSAVYFYLSYFNSDGAKTIHSGDGGNVNFKEIKQQTQEYKIKFSDLVFGSLLGKGNQGEVYRAKFRSTQVAVKKIDCRKVEPDIIDEFIQEVNIWHRLRNQFITKFMGVCLEYPHLCIVTELVHRGSLFGLLHDEDCALTWTRRLRIASDLARGMNYLHQFDSHEPIIHRDLKSLNVLITEEWRAKVADFGMTRFQDNKNVMTTCGTPLWMAPEIIRRKEYDSKVDVYSYGICLWELYTRKIPYKSLGIPAKYLVKKVAVEYLRPKIPQNCPQLYADLMRHCWTANPKQRPPFSEIVEICAAMLKDPAVTAHQPLNDVQVAKASRDEKEEHNSIVANFEIGKWQTEAKEVQLKDIIEVRGRAKSFKAIFKSDEVKVMVLKITGGNRKKCEEELDEISNFRHPRLLLFLGAYFGLDTVGVITELVKRESLNSMILNQKVVLEWRTMLQILIDICQAMAYMHGQKHTVPRFDPTRISLTEHWRVKLDVATSLKSAEDEKSPVSLWSAPEVLQNDGIVTEMSHVYTLGLIIWQMMMRKTPYNASEMNPELAAGIVKGDVICKPPANAAPSLVKLMTRCMAVNPAERESFESILAQLQKIKKSGPPEIIVDEKTAKRYCKTATVFAFRTADPCHVEKEWGKQMGKEDCWIICNSSEDDLYLCEEEVFARNYERIPNRPNQYRKVGSVWARMMDQPFALKTSDGVQYGVAGDFVVRDARAKNGDLWVVDNKTFNKIYSLMEEVNKMG